MQLSQNQFLFLSLMATALAYIIGMQVDIMDVDAAQYASISRDMFKSGNFLQVFERGNNYLDKPPLLFWLNSLSFAVFGIHTWSYKLPSVIFAIISIYATYRFSLLYYTKNAALLSAVVLATTQAYFLITNDVRTDTILCGSIMLATWHLAAYLQSGKILNFLLAFFSIGLALLAKGPIGIFTIIFAFGTQILITRNWKHLFQWQWLVGIVIILFMLLPMCIGLYNQYGTVGLKFYFWTQSFGRITGENSWANNPDPFFLFHSFLWSFLPWSFFFLLGIGKNLQTIWKQRFKLNIDQEAITTGGIIISYLALSQSAYQLPHYIYVILPYAAVVTGVYTISFFEHNPNNIFFKFISVLQFVLLAVLWVVCYLLVFVVFQATALHWIVFFAFIICTLWVIIKSHNVNKLIFPSIITILAVNVFMSSYVYPNLLQYQSHSIVGKYVSQNKISSASMGVHGEHAHSLDFYGGYAVKEYATEDKLLAHANIKNNYCMIDNAGIDILNRNDIICDTILKIKDYHITLLSLPFLNPKTRDLQTKDYFLVKFK